MQLKFIICNMDLGFEKKIIIITRVLKVIIEEAFSLLIEENTIPIIIIGRYKKVLIRSLIFTQTKA